MVELYEKEAVIRWRTAENSGSYKLTLAEFCNSGSGQKRFSGADQSLTFTASRKNTTRVFVPNKPYTIFYQGKYYQTTYELQQHEGTPIDVFFFKVLDTSGSQVEQDSEKLWGRFVRFPATTHPDQSKAGWWFVDWKWDGTKWISQVKQGVTVEVK